MRTIWTLAITAIAATLCSITIARSTTESGARMVESCESAHHMDSQTMRTGSERTIVFRFCQWPAPSWADVDGYYTIVVRVLDGPGESEASGADLADYIKIPCRKARLEYDFGSQGYYAHIPAITASAGDVIAGSPDSDKKLRTQLLEYPSRDEIVYLHNFKQSLQSAKCVS
jgi:hypothetical protein